MKLMWGGWGSLCAPGHYGCLCPCRVVYVCGCPQACEVYQSSRCSVWVYVCLCPAYLSVSYPFYPPPTSKFLSEPLSV